MKSMVQIWLNKIPILCEAAKRHPDDLTLILDAAAPTRLPTRMVNLTLNQILLEILDTIQTANFSGLPLPVYPSWFPRRTVFGKPECNRSYMSKFAMGNFMAIQGRDCPKMTRLVAWGLDDFLKGSCNCYDERDDHIIHVCHDQATEYVRNSKYSITLIEACRNWPAV